MKDYFKKYITALLIFFIVFVIYLFTIAPGVTWGDSAKLALLSHTLELDSMAGKHPLRVLIGAFFNLILPFNDVAFKQNICSAFFGALSVMFLFLLLKLYNVKTFPAFTVSFLYALSHIQWLLSVITESYTLSLSIFLLCLISLKCWFISKKPEWLYLLAFTTGLGLDNSLIFYPIGVIFVLFIILTIKTHKIQFKDTLICIFFVLLAYTPVIYLFVKDAIDINFRVAFNRVFDQQYKGYLFINYPREAIKGSIKFFIYLGYQFFGFAYLLGFLGIFVNLKRAKELFLPFILVFLFTILFTSTYMKQRSFYIMSTAFVIFAFWIGCGLDYFLTKKEFFNRMHVKIMVFFLLCLPLPALYYNAPTLAERLKVNLVRTRSLPYRDNARFFLISDKRNEKGAEQYAREVFNSIPMRNSIILADFTPGMVLEYYKVINKIPYEGNLFIIDGMKEKRLLDIIETHFLKKYRIFLGDNEEKTYHIKTLKQRYNIKSLKKAPIFEVIK